MEHLINKKLFSYIKIILLFWQAGSLEFASGGGGHFFGPENLRKGRNL